MDSYFGNEEESLSLFCDLGLYCYVSVLLLLLLLSVLDLIERSCNGWMLLDLLGDLV